MLSAVHDVAVDLQRHPWQKPINCGFLLAALANISRNLVQRKAFDDALSLGKSNAAVTEASEIWLLICV